VKPGAEETAPPAPPATIVMIKIHVGTSVLPIDLKSLFASHFSICYNAEQIVVVLPVNQYRSIGALAVLDAHFAQRPALRRGSVLACHFN